MENSVPRSERRHNGERKMRRKSDPKTALRATLSRQAKGVHTRIAALDNELRGKDWERATYQMEMAHFSLARLGATLAKLKKLER
jgi:hypothetical protein